MDGSAGSFRDQISWAVAAAIVEGWEDRADVSDAVVTSKRCDPKDCSVVELLAILAGTRLARARAKRNPGEDPVKFVVTDRPAVFSNIAFLIKGEGTEAKMPELQHALEVLANDFARAAITRQQEARIVLLSRQEAVRRGLLGNRERDHEWTPHRLIQQHLRRGSTFQGDILLYLEKDADFLTSSSHLHRHDCTWRCVTDRQNFLELSCRPPSLP